MAPLPQNNTGRVFYDYLTGDLDTSQEHTIAIRYTTAVDDPTDADSLFLAILESFGQGAFRQGWKILRARTQARLATFSVPYAPSAALLAFRGSNTDAGYNLAWEAIEDTCQGRSTTSGRRVDFSLYRAKGPIDASFRYPMNVAIQNALAVALTAGFFATIDGSLPVFYTYINQNSNSYWEGELRG